jgi:putative membrane protein
MPSLPSAFLLHAGQTVSWTSWTIHWSTVVGLAALGGVYAWRIRRLNTTTMGETKVRDANGHVPSHFAPSTPRSGVAPSPRHRLAFAAALLSVFVSLNGPLHDLSDTFLFSAHMVQHLVLTLVFPPLLLLGLDDAVLAPLLNARVVGPLLRTLTKTRWCFVIFNVVLVAWHLPPMYNAAMRWHGVHILQHLMFMGASVLLWWPIASPARSLPRLPYPGQMLYLFLMSIPMSLVSVYIVYATEVLYPAYASAPRIAGLSPLDDQRLGGLIMWIPGGLVFLLMMTVIFFRWSAKYAEDGTGGVEDGSLAPTRS